jgi:RNA polymerase sigma factor (sigma-70 family)
MPTAGEHASAVGELNDTNDHGRYLTWLKRALGRRYERRVIEDLAQEAYLRLSEYEPSSIRSRPALLLRIAENLAKSDYRRRKTARRHAEALQLSGYDEASAWGDQLESLILKETINALPPPLRDVFVLHRFHGLTYAQISATCNLPVKTVEWRMSKAMALCAARLRE